jgi:hypothetical protein
MAGEWGLVAIAWIASRQGDIQPFHDRASLELWRECGFDHRPSYATTHARLTELEEALPQLEAAIGLLVQRCMQAEPRIGRHVHIDGTEADTHSRFFHDCQEGDVCGWQREGETIEEVNRRMLGTATTDSVQRQRQREDAGESQDMAEETPCRNNASNRYPSTTTTPTLTSRGTGPALEIGSSSCTGSPLQSTSG